MCFAAIVVIALGLRFMLSRRNNRRDKKYGAPQFQHGLEDMTDKQNKSFRWVI